MTEKEQKQAAKEFVKRWTGSGYERGEAQRFWLDMLNTVFGVETEDLKDFIKFEIPLKTEKITSKGKVKKTTNFIDALILETKVLIEQKSSDKDLDAPIKQSDGSFLRPEQQARKYIVDLPQQAHPAFVITCNFREFRVYDMNNIGAEPKVILLQDLPEKYNQLSFLVKPNIKKISEEEDISVQAGQKVKALYDALYPMYLNPNSAESLSSLNKLCVRIVFLLYAEDALLFGNTGEEFHDYLASFLPENRRAALISLFRILDTPEDKRDPYEDDKLLQFQYVNGGLFSEEIEIPKLTEEITRIILEDMSEKFDWSKISPTIFGAVFESTLNPDNRREGGMHYTSVENIHKVIDPLFLDDLNGEFEEIIRNKPKTKEAVANWKKRLLDFQDKIASLGFLDPAAGSGNFLTESFLSLRRLENRVINAISGGQSYFEFADPIKVSIDQFYGIEINDFAVSVANTALWIAENQMLKETEAIIKQNIKFFPLKNKANIVEGNALRIEWESVAPKGKISYIMGNPPFVGMKYQNKEQKEDLKLVFQGIKNYGNLDYVSAWYKKASDYMKNTLIDTAFVSTNSISQGEQVSILWKPLTESGITINFACPTFRWASESQKQAAVHCVIIGFSYKSHKQKVIYFGQDKKHIAQNINGYLTDAPNIFIENHSKPICDAPKIIAGNKPVDGDFLKIGAEDYLPFITKEPQAQKYIKKLVGGYEFINNTKRYVLWLVGVSPNEIKKMPLVYERVQKVREARLAMKDAGAIKLANTPTTFRDTLNPENYIVIPIVSSENRKYVPMGFLNGDTIPTNQVQIIPNANLYHFGVLTSNVHMAWMRAVAGRLEMRYRYTAKIVYNNFPWPTPTDKQKATIEKAAQAILDARKLYPDSSLSDLYDENLMPIELRRAHQANDRAVMAAYGFSVKMTEEEIVGELFKMYKELVNKK